MSNPPSAFQEWVLQQLQAAAQRFKHAPRTLQQLSATNREAVQPQPARQHVQDHATHQDKTTAVTPMPAQAPTCAEPAGHPSHADDGVRGMPEGLMDIEVHVSDEKADQPMQDMAQQGQQVIAASGEGVVVLDHNAPLAQAAGSTPGSGGVSTVQTNTLQGAAEAYDDHSEAAGHQTAAMRGNVGPGRLRGSDKPTALTHQAQPVQPAATHLQPLQQQQQQQQRHNHHPRLPWGRSQLGPEPPWVLELTDARQRQAIQTACSASMTTARQALLQGNWQRSYAKVQCIPILPMGLDMGSTAGGHEHAVPLLTHAGRQQRDRRPQYLGPWASHTLQRPSCEAGRLQSSAAVPEAAASTAELGSGTASSGAPDPEWLCRSLSGVTLDLAAASCTLPTACNPGLLPRPCSSFCALAAAGTAGRLSAFEPTQENAGLSAQPDLIITEAAIAALLQLATPLLAMGWTLPFRVVRGSHTMSTLPAVQPPAPSPANAGTAPHGASVRQAVVCAGPLLCDPEHVRQLQFRASCLACIKQVLQTINTAANSSNTSACLPPPPPAQPSLQAAAATATAAPALPGQHQAPGSPPAPSDMWSIGGLRVGVCRSMAAEQAVPVNGWLTQDRDQGPQAFHVTPARMDRKGKGIRSLAGTPDFAAWWLACMLSARGNAKDQAQRAGATACGHLVDVMVDASSCRVVGLQTVDAGSAAVMAAENGFDFARACDVLSTTMTLMCAQHEGDYLLMHAAGGCEMTLWAGQDHQVQHQRQSGDDETLDLLDLLMSKEQG